MKMSKDFWQELKDYVRTTLGPPEGNVVCRQILKEMETAEKRWRREDNESAQTNGTCPARHPQRNVHQEGVHLP